jgi:CHASE2 domain-containing sensor protein
VYFAGSSLDSVESTIMRPRTLLQPAVRRPGALAGLGGAVSIGVYLIAMGLLTAPGQSSVAGFFASAVFFGIPVAYVATRQLDRAA